MTLLEKITQVFPRIGDIPKALQSPIPCIQAGYLVNGEIRFWEGPRQTVFSPVGTADENGLTPVLVGEYPLLTSVQAMEALDAAVTAYDHGRGGLAHHVSGRAY